MEGLRDDGYTPMDTSKPPNAAFHHKTYRLEGS